MVGYILIALQALSYVIIGDALLSWVMAPDRFPRNITSRITTPLYRPIHKVLPPTKTGGFDLSPIAVLLGIQLASSLLIRASF